MKKIIGFNGKTLDELKVVFHCKHCGCDFEADYRDYHEGNKKNTWHSYCPHCDRMVITDAQ